jgi:hypothetical protein
LLITGIDDHGRSCVVEDRVPTEVPFGRDGIIVGRAAETESCPPPPRPPGHGESVGSAATPGTAQWHFIEFPDRTKTVIHHTDSVDFDVVLRGSIDLILDDGPHRLAPGDGVVINGVDHSWQTGGSDCRLSVVVIATLPLD